MEVVLYIHPAEGGSASELRAAFRAAVGERVGRIIIGSQIKPFKRVLFPLGRAGRVFFHDFAWK